MAYRMLALRAFSCILLFGYGLEAQRPYVSIVRRSDQEQREFVTEYLVARAAGASRKVNWRGELIDGVDNFSMVVRGHPWAQVAAVAEMDRLLALSGNHDDLLESLGLALNAAGNPYAFDAIRTRLKSHPKYQLIMSDMIYRHQETVTSYPFCLIYEALLSNEPYLRTIGQTVVKSHFLDGPRGGPSDRTLKGWARALRQRYKGEPTELQLSTDPIAEIVRAESPAQSLFIIPRVKSMARTASLEMGPQ